MKKMMDRRMFVKKSLAVSLTAPFIGTSLVSFAPAKKSLRILILGGTSFLGPHQIAYAISRGHKLTTFTRGKSQPTVHREVFDQVEQLIGDRENDLSALETGEWDVVIDNSGQKTSWTENTAELLKDRVGLYMYTSSVGVYYPYLKGNLKEKDKVLLIEPEGTFDDETELDYWYAVMKATSELATMKVYGKDRSIIVRPTYMMGPGDKTDRFIYWPVRLSRGGETMVPGKKDDPVQYIDVRDVAEWMIRLAEEKNTGTFNTAGPEKPQGMKDFVTEAQTSFKVASNFVFIDDYDFLTSHEIPYVIPWVMPVGNNYGLLRVNSEKAYKNGLQTRSLQESVLDMYQWWYSDALSQERRDKFEKKPGSILLRESSILEAWKAVKNK